MSRLGAWLAVAAFGAMGCKEKVPTDAVPAPSQSVGGSKAAGRTNGRRPPQDSDCAAKGGTCVARDDKDGCKETFYSHACADEGTDQPLCCVKRAE